MCKVFQHANKKFEPGSKADLVMKGETQPKIDGLSEEECKLRKTALRYVDGP